MKILWKKDLFKSFMKEVLCKSMDWFLYDEDLHHERGGQEQELHFKKNDFLMISGGIEINSLKFA